MAFDQYREPPEELSEETRTFARLMRSMIEEFVVVEYLIPESHRAGHVDLATTGVMVGALFLLFLRFFLSFLFFRRHKCSEEGKARAQSKATC